MFVLINRQNKVLSGIVMLGNDASPHCTFSENNANCITFKSSEDAQKIAYRLFLFGNIAGLSVKKI